MCDPAENAGNGRSSTLTNSKLAISIASVALRPTRTRKSEMFIALRRDASGRGGGWSLLQREKAVEHPPRLHAARVDVEAQELAVGVREDVALLRFEHLQVLAEDLP